MQAARATGGRLARSAAGASTAGARALSAQAAPPSGERVVYEGKYSKRVGTLKKVSLGSSFFSVALLPLCVYVESGVLPVVAQVAMAGTVLFTSLSSTTILHLVASPYLCKLVEIPSIGGERRFRGSKVDLLGKTREFEFDLSDVTKPASHPFASCQSKAHGPMYLYAENVSDPEVRERMAK